MKKSADPLDFTIGRSIRYHRVRRRLSQTALGKRIGVTFQQVQKYENATNRVPASRLSHIARVLDVPIDAFFGLETDTICKDATHYLPRQPTPSCRRRLMRATAKIIDARLLNLAVELIEGMADLSA